jgi:hypothetical protein
MVHSRAPEPIRGVLGADRTQAMLAPHIFAIAVL